MNPRKFTAADVKTALTVTKLANTMGYSRQAVSGMIQRGEMHYVSPAGGKHKKIPLCEMQRWIDEHTVRSLEDVRRLRDGRRKENKRASQ